MPATTVIGDRSSCETIATKSLRISSSARKRSAVSTARAKRRGIERAIDTSRAAASIKAISPSVHLRGVREWKATTPSSLVTPLQRRCDDRRVYLARRAPSDSPRHPGPIRRSSSITSSVHCVDPLGHGKTRDREVHLGYVPSTRRASSASHSESHLAEAHSTSGSKRRMKQRST